MLENYIIEYLHMLHTIHFEAEILFFYINKQQKCNLQYKQLRGKKCVIKKKLLFWKIGIFEFFFFFIRIPNVQ